MAAHRTPSLAGRASHSKRLPPRVFGLERLEDRLTLAAELVADINTVGGSSDPTAFVEHGGIVYFQASDAQHGIELWRTDGTPQGTHLVKDLTPGPESSFPSSLTTVGDTLYFTTGSLRHDDSGGWQPSVSALWKTDGTEAGTERLRDFSLPPASCYCRQFDLAQYNDQLYFVGQDADGRGLWTSDGTPEGTQLVKAIGGDGRASLLREIRGNLFFYSRQYDRADGEDHQQLWSSDGTTVGTQPVAYQLALDSIREINGTVLEGIRVGDDYSALRRVEWPSFPSQATFSILHEYPFADSTRIKDMTVWNGQLYYLDGQNTSELWRSDGTPEGTVLVRAFNFPDDDDPEYYPAEQLVLAGDRLFFVLHGEDTGPALWKSDGTADGTEFVYEVNPGSDITPIENLTAVGSRAMFFSRDEEHGRELWTSDGTSAGTHLVLDIRPGVGDARPELEAGPVLAAGDRLFFAANDGINGSEPWVSDGSADGTLLLKDIYDSAGTSGSFPHGLIEFDGQLFFAAGDGRHGFELWHSDGTNDGTAMVRDGIPGPESTIYPADSYVAGVNDPNDHGNYYYIDHVMDTNLPAAGKIFADRLYFITPNTFTGLNELWRSDSSATELETVSPMRSLPSVWFHETAIIDDTLVFPTWDNELRGWVLWRTDGTAGGTSLVRHFGVFEPRSLTELNGSVYFAATASAMPGSGGDHDLWRTDGTAAGTLRAVNISPNMDGSNLWHLSTFNNALYFDGTSPDYTNWQIYRSDGTPTGTATITAFQGPLWTIHTGPVRAVGDHIFFGVARRLSLNPDVNQYELWVSQGVSGDAVLLKSQTNASYDSFVYFSVMDGDLYFRAGDIANGYELWKSDGTPDGTVLVKSSVAPCNRAAPCPTAVFDGHMYFPADDGIHGMELWRTDGTPEGTFMVQDINPGPRGSYPAHLLPVGDTLYFTATDGNLGVELWKWTVAPPQPQAASPDLNRDGQINLVDLALLQQDLGMVRTGGGPLRRDLNLDGWVDRRDVALLLGAIRDSAPPDAAAPAAVVRAATLTTILQPRHAVSARPLHGTRTRPPAPSSVDRALTTDSPAGDAAPASRALRARRGIERSSESAPLTTLRPPTRA
jgi:ELWxxDGT repeat protein